MGEGLVSLWIPFALHSFSQSSQIIWLTLGHLLNYLDFLASPWKFWWSSSELRPRNLVVLTSIPGDPYHQARLGNTGPACSNTKNMWLSELKKLHVNRTFFCLFISDNHQINIVLQKYSPVVLEKTLEIPLDCKEIQPVHPKGNQSWILIKRTDAAAKLLQSCPTVCNPIDGSPPDSSISGILQARTLEWAAISFSNAWKWKVKVKSLSCVWFLATAWTAALQAPLSMGFSRQEYWSGVPLPSPVVVASMSLKLRQVSPSPGRTDAEAEIPILLPPDGKNWLTGKDSDAGKDWRQEEKGTTEDEMVGWHHQLSRHEFQ